MNEAPEDPHARNVRIHGAELAELARWTAFLQLAEYLYRCELRRRERAMLEAIDALQRAELAEEGTYRWIRVASWVARRVDAAAARVARRPVKLTRGHGFGPTPPATAPEDDPLPLDEDELPIDW